MRPTGLLHEVVAGHDPDQVAIRHQGAELTYRELEQRSHQLAHALRRHGIGPGHIVALLLDRGPHLVVAELAVLTAGAAWLPLDPQLPPARLAFMTADAAVPLVLTTTDLAHLAPDTPAWCLDQHTLDGPDTPPDVDVRPDDPAYLIYTSGSTGQPKGVLVSHRSAHGYTTTAVRRFGLTPADRVAQVASPAFDAHVFDVYAALLAGATLISAARDTVLDPVMFTRIIRSERVTVSFVPPAILALLDPEQLAGTALRAISCGGETLPAALANRWTRPGLDLHNPYGPTETTVEVTDYVCPAAPATTPPPIGRPLPHHRAYVLDRRLRPTPIGVPGQLHIAGAGLAHGYLNQSALTARHFLADPYADTPGQRMYATGDIARWRSDGQLEYLGRHDRQVQLRGQRIELGEIEHTLTQHPDVRQCAVVLRDNSYLAAYLVGDADLDDVRRHLAQRLPAYMIPSAYVMLPELPLTPNGKLDATRLPDPSPRTVEYRQPRTDTELWLAETWRDLLGVDQVGAGDTLFDLGGNSLHTTQLTARVRDRFDVELDLRDLFANPTLEQLAVRIDETATTTAGEPDDDLVEIAALERMLAEKQAEKARRALSERPI